MCSLFECQGALSQIKCTSGRWWHGWCSCASLNWTADNWIDVLLVVVWGVAIHLDLVMAPVMSTLKKTWIGLRTVCSESLCYLVVIISEDRSSLTSLKNKLQVQFELSFNPIWVTLRVLLPVPLNLWIQMPPRTLGCVCVWVGMCICIEFSFHVFIHALVVLRYFLCCCLLLGFCSWLSYLLKFQVAAVFTPEEGPRGGLVVWTKLSTVSHCKKWRRLLARWRVRRAWGSGRERERERERKKESSFKNIPVEGF